MKHHKFPETLYVHEPLDINSSYDGYIEYQDAEDGDICAVYKLVKVCRVTVPKTRELVDVD